MADVTYTGKATQRNTGATFGKGEAGSLKTVVSTVSVATATVAGATYKMARIPSNARILHGSKIYSDDLATAGSPTMDVGLASVDSNITSDPDALTNGIALSSANTGTAVVNDHANSGKAAYLHVNGQTTDPQGELDVYISVLDAGTTQAGDVTLELMYLID